MKFLLTELEFLKRLKTELENGVSARAVEADDDEKAILADIGLLSAKPVIYACNMSEDDFASNIENNERYKAVCEIAKAEGTEVLPICAELEAEISSLSKEEKEMFLSDAGIESGGLDMLIQRSYSLLGLISYLTAGEPEVRAWTIKKGTKAPRRQVKYTPILSAALFVPKLSLLTSLWRAVRCRLQRKRAKYAPRARTMLCRTEI